jgi:hypothetical protein
VLPLPTPEQVIDFSAEGPLALEMKCNRCGLRYSGKFDWACVNLNHDQHDKDWDGILLSRIVECGGCGAVDDYTLAGRSYLRLTSSVLRTVAGPSGKGRIFIGVSQLWDGSTVRRPSQALARLRELAAEHPDRGEAFRRLGNSCERFGLMDEAVASWKKALDVDPAEMEAAYSLAAHWWGAGDRPSEAFAYLSRGLQAIPKAAALKREVRQCSEALLCLLRDVVRGYEGPLAIMAAWSGGKVGGQPVVHVSSVDLAKVRDFARLADFIAHPGLLGLDLTSELPSEEPTMLQELLSDETALAHLRAAPQPQRSSIRIGRNAPCPCGSGKKHKRCCGG